MASREWTSKERVKYWVQIIALVASSLAAEKVAVASHDALANGKPVETVETAKAEHDEIRQEMRDGMAGVERKLDAVLIRLDALADRRTGGQPQ
jgi:hypothetical protein